MRRLDKLGQGSSGEEGGGGNCGTETSMTRVPWIVTPYHRRLPSMVTADVT